VECQLVIPSIAQTLEVKEHVGTPLVETLHGFLQHKRSLLLLDNFEHIVRAATAVATLLSACAGVKILVTSRAPLRLQGEREYLLGPLALPDPRQLPPPDQLCQYAAVRLFIERAQAVQADFAVTDANISAVAEICARLDGLPLSIELAAARVKLLPPPALLRRMKHALPLLTGGARDLPERQQTARQTIAWSYNLLSPQEQRLLRRLAVFVGGCTLEAVEAVCVAPEGAEPLGLDLMEGLGVLVDHSLLQQRTASEERVGEGVGELRFGMLHVIREYALEQLEASGDAEALRRAHMGYFRDLSERAEPELRGPEQAKWMLLVDREIGNVRAALGWAHEHREVDPGLRLASTLWSFWWSRGRFSEGQSWREE
jgi:predicted ATPase